MVFARFADDLLQIPQIARIPAEPLFADGDRIFARLPLEVRKRFEKQPVAFVDRVERLDQSKAPGSSARSRNCPAYESCTAANIVFSSDHRRSASSRKADPFVKK